MAVADERFGPYVLCELLGSGTTGDVHRAVDLVSQREVAVKRLTPPLAADRDFQRRFRRASEVAARLQDPHVVPIHHYGEIDGSLFVEMRLLDGCDLAARIAAGSLPPEEAVGIVSQVASALDAGHAAGLVHRAVKPSNIRLTQAAAGHFAYLGDFGVARGVTGATWPTGTGCIEGALAYLAPERFSGHGDHRSDVYSLACVLYEALTGRAPFGRKGLPTLMYGHLQLPPPRPSEQVGVPLGLDAVVACGMAKDPRLRYRSAGELAAAARAALERTATDPGRAAPACLAADTMPCHSGAVSQQDTMPGHRAVSWEDTVPGCGGMAFSEDTVPALDVTAWQEEPGAGESSDASAWDDAAVFRSGPWRWVCLLVAVAVGFGGPMFLGSYAVGRAFGGQSRPVPSLAAVWATVGLGSGLVVVLVLALLAARQWRSALRLTPPRLADGERAVGRGRASLARSGGVRHGCLFLTDRRLIFLDGHPKAPRTPGLELRVVEIEQVSGGRSGRLRVDTATTGRRSFRFGVERGRGWASVIGKLTGRE